MKLYKYETREALFCGILGVFCLLSIFFAKSIGIFGFGLLCLSVWFSVMPFGKNRKTVCDVAVLVADVALLWISFLRLTAKFGYNDYAPSILCFPVAGVILLAAFYILLCASDDKKDKIAPVSLQMHTQAKKVFVLSMLVALAMLFTYVWQYYFEPACALLMSLCSVVETVRHFAPKSKIDIENRKEITLTFYERQLDALISISETCFVFRSDEDKTPYYIYAKKDKNGKPVYTLVCEKTKSTDTFSSADKLMSAPLFDGKSLREKWEDVFLYTIENVNTDYWLRTYRHD